MKLAELLGRDLRRCLHHQVLAALIHRSPRDLSQYVLAAQPHADAVSPAGHHAVSRRPARRRPHAPRTASRSSSPLTKPTVIPHRPLHFVHAAQTTSSILLLAARNTETLSILALRMLTDTDGRQLEQAGIVSLFIIAMTVVVALTARTFGLRLGVSHDMRARAQGSDTKKAAAPR